MYMVKYRSMGLVTSTTRYHHHHPERTKSRRLTGDQRAMWRGLLDRS